MGRRRSCRNEINKGTWSKEEDQILFNYVTLHGEGKWREVSQYSGLKRCAKSCRYRYLNYLKPGLKRGDISEYEQDLIINLHRQLGNRWSSIAKKLPGRTDIEIKNYWKIYLSKKLNHQQIKQGKKNKNLEDIIIQTEDDDDDDDGDMDDNGDVDDFLLSDIDDNQHLEMVNFVNDMNYNNNNNNNNNNVQQIEVEVEVEKKDDNIEKVGRHELKGAWSRKEDQILLNYVAQHGEGQWKKVPQRTGLKRCGKSCRHRYLHYLKPGIKRGNISKEEEDMIIQLHRLHGNRWTLIAKKLPGRTDSEIKNHWHAYLSKKSEAQLQSSPSSHQEHISSEDRNCTIYSPEDGFPEQMNVEDNLMMMGMSSESNNESTTTTTTTNTTSVCPASFELEYDDAFLDDFLLNIFQNDQNIIGDDLICNSKISRMDEDHNNNMVASSSSSSLDHQCHQLPEDILDFWSSSEFAFFD